MNMLNNDPPIFEHPIDIPKDRIELQIISCIDIFPEKPMINDICFRKNDKYPLP